MLLLIHAVNELFATNPELDRAEEDRVLSAFSGRQLAGFFAFSSPSPGFLAATDEGVVQALSFGHIVVLTPLPYTNLSSIHHVDSPDEGVELMAFSGRVNGEEVPVAAVVDVRESGAAGRLLRYVSSITGVPVT